MEKYSVRQFENSVTSYRALLLNNERFLCFNCLIEYSENKVLPILKTRLDLECPSPVFNKHASCHNAKQQLPGDFDGKAHRGTRCHSMQSFGGPFHSKITLAGQS